MAMNAELDLSLFCPCDRNVGRNEMNRLGLIGAVLVILLTGCGGPPKCNDSDVKRVLAEGISEGIAKELAPFLYRDTNELLRDLNDKYPVKISNVNQVTAVDKLTGSKCEAFASIDFKGHPFSESQWYSTKDMAANSGCEIDGSVVACKVPYNARRTQDTDKLLVSWQQPSIFVTLFGAQDGFGNKVLRKNRGN